MATVTAKSILQATRRSLTSLGAKVKTAVVKATGHKVDHILVDLGVEDSDLHLVSSIVIDLTVVAEGYPFASYADTKDVLAAVKKATGCRTSYIRRSAMTNNPKGERFIIECAVSGTMTNTSSLPAATLV